MMMTITRMMLHNQVQVSYICASAITLHINIQKILNKQANQVIQTYFIDPTKDFKLILTAVAPKVLVK